MTNQKGLLPVLVILLLAPVFFIGCAKTFIVSKDCKAYFFGSSDEILYKILCASGDFEKILADSGLPEDTRTSLYKAQCGDRSRDEVDRIYTSMSNKQQQALRAAFLKHGYEINKYPVQNYGSDYYDYYFNENTCPRIK